MGSNTAEQQVVALIKKGGPVAEAEVEKAFNALQALPSREFLFGSWGGGGFDTGHEGYAGLVKARWAGKDFRSVDDVDPIMVFDEKDRRVWNEDWGRASVSVHLRLVIVWRMKKQNEADVFSLSRNVAA
ncbi:MAG: hypothetical protein LQ348_006117 [Seirophora lacunosa]|nr:MAG: hypothetical protein LQ344_005417 [Seirophora lacunosa]KAI4175716.1 MAG: hypothetical protein LQ348_006117 [Seirophora lacunosa]